jgi:hypothetical protein
MSRGFLLVRAELFNVRVWHIASIRCTAKFGRYWSNSGHWSVLALNGSVANYPKQTSGPNDNGIRTGCHVQGICSLPGMFPYGSGYWPLSIPMVPIEFSSGAF